MGRNYHRKSKHKQKQDNFRGHLWKSQEESPGLIHARTLQVHDLQAHVYDVASFMNTLQFHC